MKNLSYLKKSIYSGATFFMTVLILSVGYATLSTGLSTADKVGVGSGLTSNAWNKIVDSILELDTRTNNISSSWGRVGVGTTSPAAALDITSTTTGFLPPRLTTAQRNAITSPVAGMTVYNTDLASIDYYNGSSWLNLNGKAQYIKLGMSPVYQTSPANGTVIAFDTVRSWTGITSSSNGINLKAGVTYRIEASVNVVSATGNMYLGYALYNGSTGFGETAYTNGGNATYGFKSQILEFYTPTTDQTIQVKVVDGNIGAGSISPNYNTYFIATVVK